jgi:hypothetical protein
MEGKMQALVRQLHRLLPIATPDPKIVKARKGQTVLPLRGWCQLDGWSCGLTAAFSILDYFRPGQCSMRGLRKFCDPDPDEGCGPSEISSALRRFGLKCRITRSLTKRVVDTEIGKGNPILIGVEGDRLGFEDDHWMVLHGTSKGEVLLANCLYPGRSCQWVSWSWLKPGLEPAGWGLIVSG